MPNIATNYLTVEADNAHEIMELIKDDELGIGSIDFNKIVPMPPFIFQGTIGSKEEQQYAGRNWYDWSNKNWGTKWNAFIDNFDPLFIKENAKENCISFNSAWSTPDPVLLKLSELFPNAKFHNHYTIEGNWAWCGIDTFQNGEIIHSEHPEDENDVEAICEYWGMDLEEYEELNNC